MKKLFVLLLSLVVAFIPNLSRASDESPKTDAVSLHLSPATWIQIPHGFTVGGLLSARNGSLIAWGWNLLADVGCGQTATLEIIKYDKNGALDQSFATGGIFSYSLLNSTYPYGLTFDTQGNLYVSGAPMNFTPTSCDFTDYQSFILKLSPNGILDTSFGEAGKLRTNSAYPRIYKNIIYLSGNAGVKAYTLDGKPYSGFGVNGSATLTKSSLQVTTLAFGDDAIYVSGSLINPCQAASTCAPNSKIAQYGITSLSYQGTEQNTFRGNSNFIYSNGYKDGPSTAPVLIDDKLYFTGSVLSAVQPVYSRDTFILSTSTSGAINSNFGTLGRIWLSTASPSTSRLQYAEKTRTNQLLLVTVEKNVSRNFLVASSKEKPGNGLVSIGSITAGGYLDQNADGTFLSYSEPDSVDKIKVQLVTVS